LKVFFPFNAHKDPLPDVEGCYDSGSWSFLSQFSFHKHHHAISLIFLLLDQTTSGVSNRHPLLLLFLKDGRKMIAKKG
jgi:hypothetical protein